MRIRNTVKKGLCKFVILQIFHLGKVLIWSKDLICSKDSKLPTQAAWIQIYRSLHFFSSTDLQNFHFICLLSNCFSRFEIFCYFPSFRVLGNNCSKVKNMRHLQIFFIIFVQIKVTKEKIPTNILALFFDFFNSLF